MPFPEELKEESGEPDKEKVYYTIDTIYVAVLDYCQIRFQYYEYTLAPLCAGMEKRSLLPDWQLS